MKSVKIELINSSSDRHHISPLQLFNKAINIYAKVVLSFSRHPKKLFRNVIVG